MRLEWTKLRQNLKRKLLTHFKQISHFLKKINYSVLMNQNISNPHVTSFIYLLYTSLSEIRAGFRVGIV